MPLTRREVPALTQWLTRVAFGLTYLRRVRGGLSFNPGVTSRQNWQVPWESQMTWKAPKIVEVPVGMEINMYACAARK